MNLGDYLKSINETKENVIRHNSISSESAEKLYPKFVVSRLLSYHEELVPLLAALNCLNNIENLQHYELLLDVVPKKKRWSTLIKPDEEEEIIQVLCELYGYSVFRAKEAVSLMKPQDVEALLNSVRKGGAEKAKRR